MNLLPIFYFSIEPQVEGLQGGDQGDGGRIGGNQCKVGLSNMHVQGGHLGFEIFRLEEKFKILT